MSEENMQQVSVPITLGLNEKAEINIIKTMGKPAYDMAGNDLGSRKKNTHSINLVKTLLNLSKSAQYLMELVYDGRDSWIHPVTKQKSHYLKCNTSFVDPYLVGKSASSRKKITDGYIELFQKNLLVRTKRSHYIINPRLLIPNDGWRDEEELYLEARNKELLVLEEREAKKEIA